MSQVIAGSKVFYNGLPLVSIERISADEAWERDRFVGRLETIREYSGAALLATGILFIGLLGSSRMTGTAAFLSIAFAAVLALYIRAMSHRIRGLRAAVRPKERWLFQGKSSMKEYESGLRGLISRIGCGSKPTEAILQYPSWLEESPSGQLKPLLKGSIAFVAADRDAEAGHLTHDEKLELWWRLQRLEAVSGYRCLALVGSLGATCYLLSMGLQPSSPGEFTQQLIVGLGIMLGLETGWVGLRGLTAGLRARPNLPLADVIRLPASSSVVLKASHHQQILLQAMVEVEILRSGLIWSMDGKPAAWRLNGTLPEFIPQRLVPGRLPSPAPPSLAARA